MEDYEVSDYEKELYARPKVKRPPPKKLGGPIYLNISRYSSFSERSQYEKDHNIGVLIGPSKKLVITLITLIGIIMLLGCAGIVYIGYCFLGTTVDAPGKNINP